MQHFQHILFPVDFSERSEAAVPWVKEMRTLNHARLTILHAAEVPFQWAAEAAVPYDFSQRTCEEWLETCRERMGNFVCEYFRELASSADAQSVCLLGDPGMSILHFVENNDVDLIMMPSHGRGPFRSFLLGSVTAKVLHDANCAVWTAAHIEDSAPPEKASIHKIVCAVDLKPESQHVLEAAANLAETFGAEVFLVHSDLNNESRPEKYFGTEYREFVLEQSGKALAKLQQETGTHYAQEALLGPVSSAIRDAAIRHDADAVVIGRGCMKSTLGRLRTDAYAVIRDAPCPVMSF